MKINSTFIESNNNKTNITINPNLKFLEMLD